MSEKDLSSLITEALQQGKNKEDIYKDLLNKGELVSNIQETFQKIAIEQSKEDTSKKTIRLILTIGAILIGAGIFSFIAANWQEISKTAKILIILFFMLTSYSFGWHLKERLNYSKTGDAFILLGILIYGAGIFLVAQMFNIRANWPDGFILWMFGTLALGYVFQTNYIFYFAVILCWIALLGQPFNWFNNFGGNSFLLTSSLILFTATVLTLYTGHIFRNKTLEEFKDFY